MFFYIEPEVAGGFGPNSELCHKDRKLKVVQLNYEFDGWLGDALLTTTPCFIVTDEARDLIENTELSGVKFADVEITRSDLFMDVHGDIELPRFWWMIVAGKAAADDFGMSNDLTLVASERALAILRRAGLAHATIEPVGRYVR